MNNLLKIITIQTSPREFTVCGYFANGDGETGSYKTRLAHRPADAVKAFIDEKGFDCAVVHAHGTNRVQVFVNLKGSWTKIIK